MNMSIVGPDEIRSHREMWSMTREELAKKVGVPVGAVIEWERGISLVPEGKVEAVRKALDITSEPQAEFGKAALLRQLGRLAKQRREEIGIGRVPLAKEAGMGSDKTIVEFEFGRRLMSGTNQRRLEKALGWRLGVIEDVMRMVDRKASSITMEEVDAEDSIYLASRGGIDPSLGRPLRYVSDADLLEELRLRLESATPPPRLYGQMKADAKNLFGLAASTNAEHLEDEESGEEGDSK